MRPHAQKPTGLDLAMKQHLYDRRLALNAPEVPYNGSPCRWSRQQVARRIGVAKNSLQAWEVELTTPSRLEHWKVWAEELGENFLDLLGRFEEGSSCGFRV